MENSYKTILCYLAWAKRRCKKLSFIKNFLHAALAVFYVGKAEQKEEVKKMSSGGSEIAGRFGNFSNKLRERKKLTFYSEFSGEPYPSVLAYLLVQLASLIVAVWILYAIFHNYISISIK